VILVFYQFFFETEIKNVEGNKIKRVRNDEEHFLDEIKAYVR